jgi:hypothetical protein
MAGLAQRVTQIPVQAATAARQQMVATAPAVTPQPTPAAEPAGSASAEMRPPDLEAMPLVQRSAVIPKVETRSPRTQLAVRRPAVPAASAVEQTAEPGSAATHRAAQPAEMPVVAPVQPARRPRAELLQ